jgi:DNA-binding response OmpR family regulator
MAKILIVDDNAPNRDMLRTLLAYAGHHVIEASDGREGLAAAQADPPELVIADIVMPTMDGFEFVRQLRNDPAIAHTKVIFYTAAYYESEARDLASRCGVSHIMTKPLEPQDILRKVDTVLGITTAALPVAPSLDEFDREHQRVLTDKLSQKVTELEAVGLRLATLIELGQELASEHNEERLLDRVCSGARRIVDAEYAAVGILTEDGTALGHFFASGLDHEAGRCLSSFPPEQGDLLEATRAQASKQTLSPSCISLMSLIPDTVGMMGATASTKGIDIDVDLTGYLPVVDDDQDLRRGLNIRLRANGYETVFAQDAITAVSEARKNNPDLIILDIGLPGGDGFVVMERLSGLAALGCIPVIVLSARDPEANRERAMKAGAVAFLQKPADNQDLLSAIRNALEGKEEHQRVEFYVEG